MIDKIVHFMIRVFTSNYVFILCLSAFGLVLCPLLALRFPPGGDPGHMLALSYTFEGVNVEGELKYVPIMPFLMFLLYKVSFGNFNVLLPLIKILSVTLLFVLGGAFYLLTKQLSKNRCAGILAFFLTVLNPVFSFQVLWGGYPQFLGMTLAILSIVWLLKTEEDTGYGVFACACFASLTVGTHYYTTAFLLIYLLVYMIIRIASANKKSVILKDMGKIIALVVPLSAPYVSTYLRIIDDSKTLPYPAEALFRIREIWLVTYPWLVIQLAILMAFAAFFFVKYRRHLTKSTRILSILAISVCVMVFFTPSESINRITHFLMIPAIPAISISISRFVRPTRSLGFGRIVKGQSKSRWWIKLLLIGLVFSIASSSYERYLALIDSFSPLDDEVMDAFEVIRRNSHPNDRVIVESTWPNIDGWWLEAISRRGALIDGPFRWYRLQSEIDRVIIAKTLLYGKHIIDGGNLKLLHNSPELANNTLLILTVSGAGALNLVSIDNALANVISHPKSNYSDTRTTSLGSALETTMKMDKTSLVQCIYDDVIIERTLSLDPIRDLAIIKYAFRATENSIIDNATIGMRSYYGVVFQDLTRTSNVFQITYMHGWTGVSGRLQIEAKTNASVTATFIDEDSPDRSYLLATFTPHDNNATLLNVSIEVEVEGIDVSPPTAYPIYEKLDEEQIKYVYIRANFAWIRKKLELDPHFEQIFKGVEVAVYKYVK